MEKRIELEKRGRKPDQIYELNLDNSRSTSIEGLTDDFTNLKSLSLINVGLTSLKGFPKLPNLQKLELSDNRISSGLNLLLTSPMLTSLNLSGNKLKDLESLEPLKQLTHLQSLVLFNNDVTTIENYREQIFKMLTTLKYLDGFDAKEQEADDSEHEFPTCSLNGNDEESDSEDGDDEDIEEEEELDDEENELGLEAVYHDNLEEESEGDDYDGEGEKEEDDEDIEEEESLQAENDAEEDTTARGKKRKHDGEEEVV